MVRVYAMVFVFAVWSSSVAAQTSFSFQECLRFTLEHNPNSTIYRNDVEINLQKLREKRSAFLPSVTGTASFNYNLKLQSTVIPAGIFGPTETRFQMGSKFVTNPYLEADQAILDRGAAMDIKTAKVNVRIADLTVQKENETLLYNTATAYYDALSYRAKQQLLLENEKQDQQLLDILRLQYQQGTARKSEYQRAAVNLKNVQAELAQNDVDYQQSLNKLKNAMGMRLELSMEVADSVDTGMSIAAPEAAPVFDENAVVDYRIDNQNIVLQDIDVKKKKAAFLPTLSIVAQYGANAYGSDMSNSFNQWYDYSLVGLRLSVPLFSGFKKSAQLRQSVLNAKNQRLTQQVNLEGYRLDFRNSNAKLSSSYTSLIENKHTMELAREVLDESMVEYREGKSTLSTFLDDDHSYKEARSNYISSLIDFLDSRLALEKSRGTLITYLNNQK